MLLLCFALAKIGTVIARWFGFLPSLLQSQLPDGQIMLSAGIGELVAVIFILRLLNARRSCQLIAFIGASFLAYRYFMFHVPCPCMGAAPTLIPWLKLNERIILMTVPLILLFTGLWGWAREANLASR